ncbi:MAG: hypothetical protein RLZZ70_619 [Candidatus Parcubacteria bacterium]|jgi:hypothetical protein
MPILYTITLIIGSQFVVIHTIAEYFELYWRYGWLDMPVHLIGGVLLTLILYTFVLILKYQPARITLPRLLALATFPLLVWEVFGVYRYGGLKPGFGIDSSLDILFGILGVVAGYYIARALMRI